MFTFCACSSGVNLQWKIDDLGAELIGAHTELQAKFLNDKNLILPSSVKGETELSRPVPIHLEWSATDGGSEVAISKYLLEFSTDTKFDRAITYETTQPEYDVYNLLLGTPYYYRVTAVTEGGKKSVSPLCVLETAALAPRNMYIDGVTNVRDLGGWSTENGVKVKQGMLIRCGRLNKSEQPEVEIEITQTGIYQFKEVLGVRSEIDLRMPDAHDTENGGITSSPLGKGVKYKNIPMEWWKGGENYLKDPIYRPAILSFFEFIADESNYPIIFHCNIGTDRTGLFAFLVNGLLGVSEDDLYRDYLFSNYANIGGNRSIGNIKSYVDTIKSHSGSTLSQKIENCLLKIGVQQSHVDAVRRIMTEE